MKSARTIAVIQARLGSTRLPGKVLREVRGRPLLAWQLSQLARARSLDRVVVATTGSPADDEIARYCRAAGHALFRGSESDVLDRYYRAARAFEAEVVVRLTSDCPLIDPDVVDGVVAAYLKAGGRYDYVANTAPPPGSFPDGMDVEVFSMAALERAWREARTQGEREHVTFPFWRQPERYSLLRVEALEDASDVRVTVDYPEDLAVVEEVLEAHDGRVPPMNQLVAWMRGRFDDPARGHVQGEGWSATAADPVSAAPLELARGDELYARAARRIPGGAQTFSKMPAQYVDGVAPKVLVRGAGARVWDADGNEFLDYVLGLGPAVLGHARHEVNRAAFECAEDAFCAPSLPHPLELELAEKICALVPCAERVRFGKNGSDVTAGAVRIARGLTGRDVVACSGYHGWQDWYIGATSRHRGVPEAVRELTVPFPYGDLAQVERVFELHPDNVACVILEPVCQTPPPAGYLEGLRELCDRHGALLVFDEVITGFRLDLGGAQALYGVTPDLATFGKGVANGYPLSILCGKAAPMELLEEAFFSFTFGGELPAMAAALKTIELLEREDGIAVLHAAGRLLREGIERAARVEGLHELRAVGLDFFPGYAMDAAPGASSLELVSLMQQELVRRGVLTRTCLFVSTAHGPADLDATAEAFGAAARAVRRALDAGDVRGALEGELIQPVFRAQT